DRVLRRGCHLVVQLVDELAVPPDRPGGRGHVDAERIADRMSGVERLEQGEFLAVLDDELRPADENPLPLPPVGPRPHAGLEGARRRGHRVVHVPLGSRRHLGEDCAVSGGDRRERARVRGGSELAADEQPALGADRGRSGLPVLEGTRARHPRYRSTASWSISAPRPGAEGTWIMPSESGRMGAMKKSRRSGVHPGGSNGYSRYGPAPTPAATCR